MNIAYEPAAWQTLCSVVGASAASLTGLLFVALSANRRAIMTSHIQQARAVETLGTLLSLLVLSLLVLVPGQDNRALGTELGVYGLLLLAGSVAVQRGTLRRLDAAQRRFWAGRLAVLDIGTAGFLVAGATLVARMGGGLYWLVPTVLVYFLWAATNAWVLVLHDTDERG
ncbi:MAG: hypothetical protein NVSMB29_16630 [Candidatus Dormibacteria bacterium]